MEKIEAFAGEASHQIARKRQGLPTFPSAPCIQTTIQPDKQFSSTQRIQPASSLGLSCYLSGSSRSNEFGEYRTFDCEVRNDRGSRRAKD